MRVYHGENQVASRAAFLTQKNAASANIVNLTGDSLTLTDLIQATSNQTLFGSGNLVVIEGLFSRRPGNDKKQLLAYLADHVSSITNLLIWEPKDVSAQLKDFSAQSVSRFDLPKHIFKFLDDLTIQSFHNCLSVMPVEQIFASLSTRLHKVLLGTGSFTRKFSFQELKKINLDLLTIDFAQKTSSSPYNLQAGIELWLLKIVR